MSHPGSSRTARVFLVPGYGVPKDILRDQNMSLYLRVIANTIYDRTAKTGLKPLVIFSGGPTDMRKPFRRTEAQEMYRWMKFAIRSPDFRRQFRTWKIRLEKKSLSTLENALLSSQIIPSKSRVVVFSEFTRADRWKFILKALSIRGAVVIPIDFDTSANRYRLKEVQVKERSMLKYDRWALKKKQNLRRHHEYFKKRLAYLRAAGPENHVEAIYRFWKKFGNEIRV